MNWLEIAIEADKRQKEGNIESAIKLYESILGEINTSWPLIRLAEIVSDQEYKINLYKKAIEIDDSIWGHMGIVRVLLELLAINAEDFNNSCEKIKNFNGDELVNSKQQIDDLVEKIKSISSEELKNHYLFLWKILTQ
jgi:hypothetical protein